MEQMPHSLLGLDSLEDPYGFFAEWRETAPVLRGAEGYAVTRYTDVWRLMRDHRISHRFPRHMLAFGLGDGAMTDFQTNSLLNREGDDHHRLRKLMNQAFHAGTVRQLRTHVGDLVDEALQPMLDGVECDLVDALAFPLPSAVICELLGIPKADREEVRRQTAYTAAEDNATADAAITWLRDYMCAVLAERVPEPEGDLFQRMLAAEEDDDRLSHQEIVDNAILLFAAGFETTKNVIASGVVALAEFPDEQRKLWDDPELTPSAVEEFLRYDAPVRFSPRVALTDIDDIPAGSFVQLWLASANHDPRQFGRPDRLDIERDPNQHVAFGGGAHYCLGAMLARVEADVVFRRLATRVKRIELAGAPVRSVGGLGTYAAVPVRFHAA
ncbi:MAG TPA: cytochrome P450 [Acidimicrobiales bacterium]|nr:cytochrome P450 [Acidimicrobiales bacterium]